MTWYCLAGKRGTTVIVECDEYDTIINAPPIVERFIGLNIERLERWINAKKQTM